MGLEGIDEVDNRASIGQAGGMHGVGWGSKIKITVSYVIIFNHLYIQIIIIISASL